VSQTAAVNECSQVAAPPRSRSLPPGLPPPRLARNLGGGPGATDYRPRGRREVGAGRRPAARADPRNAAAYGAPPALTRLRDTLFRDGVTDSVVVTCCPVAGRTHVRLAGWPAPPVGQRPRNRPGARCPVQRRSKADRQLRQQHVASTHSHADEKLSVRIPSARPSPLSHLSNRHLPAALLPGLSSSDRRCAHCVSRCGRPLPLPAWIL